MWRGIVRTERPSLYWKWLKKIFLLCLDQEEDAEEAHHILF